ncbi:MAG: ATP synthase F1 subunit gamma [Bacteroidales bacterium]|nr:ATP synthase F1 subunit gamma [Bacteroidales bacterium]
MASLKETKTRIASVKSTLQITAAMKMVAAAKLHRAQQAIGNMVPYQEKLHEILQDLLVGSGVRASVESPLLTPSDNRRVAIVAFSSNSSLCGGFNATAVKSLLGELDRLQAEGLTWEDIDFYPAGRKVAEAGRKVGLKAAMDASHLLDKPAYAPAAQLAQTLIERFEKGEIGRIILLYNHYKSNASQPPVRETYLPLTLPETADGPVEEDLIVEPGKKEVLESLLPKVLLLKIYTVLMDSYAAEQAARTVAMQLASDNADELLEQLTLEYNKRRQQAITSELLDIVGGSLA